jgi:hypothetical protein
LPFTVLLAIKSGGYFLAASLVHDADGQPGKSKGIRFSFQRAYTEQRNIQGQSQALSGAYAGPKSIVASRPSGDDDCVYRGYLYPDLLCQANQVRQKFDGMVLPGFPDLQSSYLTLVG